MCLQRTPRGLPRSRQSVHRRGGASLPAQRAVRNLHRHFREALEPAVQRNVCDSRAGGGAQRLRMLRPGGMLLMAVVLLLALTLLLAFANGANDVSKGIATLVGS